MSPREATKPPPGAPRPTPPPAPPAKTAAPDPWERVAAALEGMAHAIAGLAEGQRRTAEGVAGITAALTGNAAVIKREVDRQARRNQQIRALADEVRTGKPAPATTGRQDNRGPTP